ncbi:nitrate reductase molybdenum cofactor assembly chaperone [Desulfococcus sp.]|uniref:nitrate reductase molybdenum cofactor assembly chaperone n=1 Tax=Desulfococcus sp. TaxID=2025834 RepID=UPI0035936FD0
MTENDRMQLKVIGFLLEYPDAAWMNALAGLDGVVAALEDGRGRQALRRFLGYAGGTPGIRLQETYTAAFDLNPSASLNLSYHLMGDSEDRGKALAGLLGVYHREGYDVAAGELPDYLPMVLEFLSVCPEPEGADLLWSCLGKVSTLAAHLEEEGHPYAGLLGLAADILRGRGCGTPSAAEKEA